MTLNERNTMLLVDYVRDEIGVPMRALHVGRHIGWTTDAAKAEAMSAAGVHVIAVRASMLGPVAATDDPARIIGYDASFAIGREVAEAQAA